MERRLSDQIDAIIRNALQEDLGDGDVTTLSTVPADLVLRGRFVAKADGILAGVEVARRVFFLLDQAVRFEAFASDGASLSPGEVFGTVTGSARTLLSAERVALNLLQRMSGIATMTRKFVEAVAGTKAVILDTRKTAPGLRLLDKWAVRLGGGQNHRFGLYDMVMIKENHIAAAGGITAAVQSVRRQDARRLPIEVEVTTLAELQETLRLGVDRILLDNMSLAEMRQAVRLAGDNVPLEASGNVTLDNVAEIAATGVSYISIGMLTHSVQNFDVSFLLVRTNGK